MRKRLTVRAADCKSGNTEILAVGWMIVGEAYNERIIGYVRCQVRKPLSLCGFPHLCVTSNLWNTHTFSLTLLAIKRGDECDIFPSHGYDALCLGMGEFYRPTRLQE